MSFIWDDENKENFLNCILNGLSIETALNTLDLNQSGFFDACANDPDFENKFETYTKHGLKLMASGLLDDIDNPDKDITRVKMRAEHIRWLLTRLVPETYGDKMKLEVEHVDISGALSEARNRIPQTVELTAPNSYTIKDLEGLETPLKPNESDQVHDSTCGDQDPDTQNQSDIFT